jgi:hypothetical protein
VSRFLLCEQSPNGNLDEEMILMDEVLRGFGLAKSVQNGNS